MTVWGDGGGVRGFVRGLFRVAVPLAAAAIVAASCGGGGGSGGAGPASGAPPEPQPTLTPMPEPISAPMPAPCVEIHGRGCVPESEYEAQAGRAAVGYAQTASFRNQWGLRAVGADRAYANLELRLGPDAEPGAGVIVGVLDTGIDLAHRAFRNTRVSERILPDARNEDGSEFSHGTAVASIIAGREDPVAPADASGVAWGADLAVFAMRLRSGDGTYRPVAVGRLGSNAEDFAGIFREILAWRDGSGRIDFLNLSLGVQGLIERYGEEDLREPMTPLIAVMAQDGADDKLVFVWAAGNSHGNACDPALPECVNGAVEASSVDLPAGLAARFPELKPQTLAVVAIGRGGAIAGFSNRCGIAQDYCLAAPGEDVALAYFGPHRGRDGVRGTAVGRGTSYAAPMVTGGLALMKQLFRGQLSNTDLAARLLHTADRSGVYADASVYGRGLMDLGAATAPVGDPVVAAGRRVDGPGALVGDTGLSLGGAFGDRLAAALANREIAAFDSLGAPFWYDFGGFSRAEAGPSLSERLAEFRRISAALPSAPPAEALRIPLTAAPGEGGAAPALHLTRSGASAAARAGHFALAGDGLIASVPVAAGLTASALTGEGADGETPANGAALAWRPPGSALGLSAGWLGERRSLLGTVSRGAFGRVRGSAAFAGVESGMALGGWHIGGAAEIGAIRARTAGRRAGADVAARDQRLRAARHAADRGRRRVRRVALAAAPRRGRKRPLRHPRRPHKVGPGGARARHGRRRPRRPPARPRPPLATPRPGRRNPPRRHPLPPPRPPQRRGHGDDPPVRLARGVLRGDRHAPQVVMPGLVPGIHVLRRRAVNGDKRAGRPTWMPGTSPGMTTWGGEAGTAGGRPASQQRVVEVLPVRVLRADQVDLPRPRPMLHRLLALDRGGDLLVAFGVDQPLEPVALGEPLDRALAMLPGPARDVGGHAHIERPVPPVGHDVHPPPAHPAMLQDVDARNKSGHDGGGGGHSRIPPVVMPGLVPGIHAAAVNRPYSCHRVTRIIRRPRRRTAVPVPRGRGPGRGAKRNCAKRPFLRLTACS